MGKLINRRLIDFNKEVLFGEVGGIIGAPLVGFLASIFSARPGILASFTLVGSITGAAILWLSARIYDRKKRKQFSVLKLGEDIAFYTPVAFTIAFFVCYPSIFLISRFLLRKGLPVVVSSASAEFSAFLMFLIAINIYRFLLIIFFDKSL